MRSGTTGVGTMNQVDTLEVNDEVLDEAEAETAAPLIYDISSYGADYTVDTIVKRMRSGAFVVPDFQRAYVWSQPKASRFIESLLLGLPVPGVFLYKEEDAGKYLIVDGQQRLKTLHQYFDGFFGERKFRLQDIEERWNEKTIDELSDLDKQNLEDAIIHTIIFKQDLPAAENSSIYHVFERLNTGGMTLNPQEIRNCINHGPFRNLLSTLNKNEDWRVIYGKVNKRFKDEELILRFLAMHEQGTQYRRPMKDFLNTFMARHERLAEGIGESFTDLFAKTLHTVRESLGDRAFRPEKLLNAAVFDSVMVGIAKRTELGDADGERLRSAYEGLLANPDFQAAYVRATADEENVKTRLKLAQEAFLGA